MDNKATEKIQRLKQWAVDHPYSLAELVEIGAGRKSPPGDDPHFSINLDIGYRVVYTIEEQKMGKAHHLSVSVNDPELLPHLAAVQMIMEQFGFAAKIYPTKEGNCAIWLEENITPKAIDVLEYQELRFTKSSIEV